jgi:uncharacterized protein YigA (DUF484 family)
MTLQSDEVCAWLRTQPHFFDQHPEFLPTAKRESENGQVVSLLDRQLPALRDRNRILETRLAELIDIARENDALSDKVQSFAIEIMSKREPEHVADAILEGLREGFKIPYVSMRLWGHALGRDDSAWRQPVLAELQTFAVGMSHPVCGHHPIYEVNRWFGEDAPRLKSFALAPLGHPAFGLLVLASEEADRFYPEMGTLFLGRLAALATAAIESCASLVYHEA